MEFYIIPFVVILCFFFVAPVHTAHPCMGYTGLKHFRCDDHFMMCAFWCDGQMNCMDRLDETDCWWEKEDTDMDTDLGRLGFLHILTSLLCFALGTCRHTMAYCVSLQKLWSDHLKTMPQHWPLRTPLRTMTWTASFGLMWQSDYHRSCSSAQWLCAKSGTHSLCRGRRTTTNQSWCDNMSPLYKICNATTSLWSTLSNLCNIQ